MAFTARLPRINECLGNQLPIRCPIRVGAPGKQLGNGLPGLPLTRGRGHETRRQATGNRDLDLLPTLNPSDQFGGILSKLSQPNCRHRQRL
jgi:hypothetical protein